MVVQKLDGVSPIDSRPSIVKREKITYDMWYVTREILHHTRDMWHIIPDKWEKANLLSKSQPPISDGWGVKGFWGYFHTGWLDWSVKYWMAKVFVEQPLATPDSLNIWIAVILSGPIWVLGCCLYELKTKVIEPDNLNFHYLDINMVLCFYISI